MRMILILFSMTLFSCSSEVERGLVGTWKVSNYTFWEKASAYLKGVRSLEAGHELVLNADSTYSEQSCGNFFAGRWTRMNDSLILNTATMWYRKNYDHSKAIINKT